MEAPLEDETPADGLAGTEGPSNGEELKPSAEALTFMSSIGECVFSILSRIVWSVNRSQNLRTSRE